MKMNKEIDIKLPDNIKINSDTPEGWLYIGDDKVRYVLGKPGIYDNLLVVGLNPSTATPKQLDPTIKRISKIAQREKFGGWMVINLYAMRTPNPDELPVERDMKLSENNLRVIEWIDNKYNIGRIYAAWGTNIEKRTYLLEECQKIVDATEEEWYTRGRTRYGHPKHPLYVPYDEEMEWFPVQDYLWSFDYPMG
jgi:hypothetical protein